MKEQVYRSKCSNATVTGRQVEPLPPEPVFSDFYVPSEGHHNRELTFITLSMIGTGAFLWYYEK